VRRHEFSVFSLLAGVVFGTVAIVLLATDGRFTSYDISWGWIAALAGGGLGIALVAGAVLAIARERRIDGAGGFSPDE
jgi:c-di-GMP-binding flagellar brake protein YcgR